MALWPENQRVFFVRSPGILLAVYKESKVEMIIYLLVIIIIMTSEFAVFHNNYYDGTRRL